MSKIISLVELKKEQEAEIISIAAGWRATKRLADLGLVPETKIKILRNAPILGPIEIQVRGSRVVIGRGLASKILIKLI